MHRHPAPILDPSDHAASVPNRRLADVVIPVSPMGFLHSVPVRAIAVAGLMLVLVACGEDAAHEVDAPRKIPSRMATLHDSPASLYGRQLPEERMDPSEMFDFQLPEGWVQRPSSQHRLLNFVIAGGTGGLVECSFAQTGGTERQNIDRWREQMGQGPIEDESMVAIPTQQLMGANARYVVMEGTYTGRTGGPKPDFALAALVAAAGPQTFSLKMTGPATTVQAEQARFLSFASTLRPSDLVIDTMRQSMEQGGAGDAGQSGAPQPSTGSPDSGSSDGGAVDAGSAHGGNPHGGDPHGAGGMPAGHPATQAPPELAWQVPAGFEVGPERMMRLVTLKSGKTEIWITLLPGPAGGVLANLNRWLNEVSAPLLSAAGVRNLPQVPLLGDNAPWIRGEGDWSGMRSGTVADAVLYGAVGKLPHHTVFVKMVGPAAAPASDQSVFLEFCRSLAVKPQPQGNQK